MTKPAIGFIGLGLMGAAMVRRLQSLDYPVHVIANRSRTEVDNAIGRGAEESSSYAELAEKSDIVMLCVDTSETVENCMLGETGVIAGLKNGSVVIDFGTSLPDSTRKLGALVEASGSTMLDAPLGRTPAHAEDGLLNIMGAGDTGAFEKVTPVLQDLGENVFHVGPLGAGHTVKLMNNMIGMTMASAISEAFAMADKNGVERQTLYDVISAGPLHSGMMDLVKGYAVDGDPNQLAFAIKNAFKDVSYYKSMAESAGLEKCMGDATHNALKSAVDSGNGERMVSELVDSI